MKAWKNLIEKTTPQKKQREAYSLEVKSPGQEHYFLFFENAPIALWIEDFSKVNSFLIDKAKKSNIEFKKYIANNPKVVEEAASKVILKDVNKKAVALYGATSKDELFKNIEKVYTENSNVGYAKLITAILNGESEAEVETTNKTLGGKEFDISIKFHVIEGIENSLENIIISVEDISKRKNARKKLLKSNQLLKDQFNHTPLAAIMWDADFKVTEWNESANRIFGYTAKEALGKTAYDLIIPVDLKETIAKGWSDLISKRNNLRHTNKNITKSGKIITCDWYNVLIINDAGQVIGVSSLADDITDRRASKKQLKKSERKFRNIFEKSSDAVLVVKKDELIDCNLAAVKTFKYLNKEDLLNVKLFDLAPKILPDGSKAHDKAQKMMQIAIEEGVNRFRCHHLRKNGIVFPTEVTITKLEEHNQNSSLHIVIKDISDQVKQETLEDVLYNISKAALTIPEFKDFSAYIREELHKIIDCTNFFIALYEKETDMISTPFMVDETDNMKEFPAYKTLTGYVIKTKKPLLADYIKTGELYESGEANLVGADSKIWLGVPLIIGDEVIGAIVVQSYTDEKAYNSNDVNLLEFVADQISTTIQRKKVENELQKALVKAKEADKLKSSFLANMSHEIRTPMNGIIGFSELFLKPNLTEEDRKNYAQIVINSSKQLLSIVNDILDISKIEAGAIKLHYENVNINKLLDGLFKFYEPISHKNNINLVCEKGLDNYKSVVHIDKTKLNQVLTNLLSNAFKFTDEGSITFGYEFEGAELQFYVKDTGIGIEKSHQPKIFDRFMQAENNLTKQNKGTGLGLAISKKFVELFGGKIWLNSSEKGTKVYFTIPYKKAPVPDIASVIEEKISIETVKNKEITILIAEDEIYNMMYMNELFSETNFKIIEAENGKQAVEMVQNNPEIDLVLMDIKMPVMNGKEAMQAIKQTHPKLPVIGLSAFAMASDKEDALKEGFHAYLTKPIDKQQLFETIAKFTT